MNIWTLNSSFKTCRCCAHSLLLREKIVSASSEHKHFSIRTQTRRVPQSAENTSASASQRERERVHGREREVRGRTHLGRSVCWCWSGLHSLVLTQYSQASPVKDTLMKRVFGVTRCVRSGSLTQCFSAGREAAEHKDVIRRDRSEGSATSGRPDRAEERS